MNDNDNQDSMDPAVFETFLREIHNRIQEFDVDKEQTTDFFNDAIEQICNALDQVKVADRMVEAGVDLVLDEQHHPWLIEINSRPRGRMEALASLDPQTYLNAHIDACARPLQVIAAWAEAKE